MKKYRILDELNYFNALACLLVILIHVLSVGVTGLEPDSWQAFVVYIPWRAAQFVVPAFLFSGAVKMEMQFSQRQVGYSVQCYIKYIAERCRSIVLPYVVFVLIYYIVYGLMNYVEWSTETLVSGLFLGNLSAHFYYIIVVVQFYLLEPVWRWLVRRVPCYVAIIGAVMISLLTMNSGKLLEMMDVDFQYTDRIFLVYILFWVMGLYAGKYYEVLSESLVKYRKSVFISLAAVILCVLAVYVQYAHGKFILEMDQFKLFSDCLTILILLTFCIWIKDNKLRFYGLVNVLERINAASYFVYLSHCLVITVVTAYLLSFNVTRISQLVCLRALAGYSLPFAGYWIFLHCRLCLINMSDNIRYR